MCNILRITNDKRSVEDMIIWEKKWQQQLFLVYFLLVSLGNVGEL